MRLAVITDEIDQNFEHALDVMLEYGVQGAELRGLWGTNIADLDASQIARAKNALAERGMQAVGLATPFYKCDLEASNPADVAGAMHLAKPRGFAEQMQILQRCIELASQFDTRLIRIFSFWRKMALTPEIEARIVEALAEPVALAEKEGVVLGLENEHACLIGTGDEASRIASTLNSPSLRIVWDPGNAFHAGETPYPYGYLAVRPYLEHIHVKDVRNVETPDKGIQPQWCIIGEGDIDYVGQFRALRQDGYTGWISLETHYLPPTGSAPDGRGTPEEGSRACLAALKRLVEPTN